MSVVASGFYALDWHCSSSSAVFVLQDVSRSAGILESLPRDSWASSTRRELDGDLVDAPGLVVPEFVQRRDLRELRFDRDDAEYLSTFFIAESWFKGSV